VHENIACTAEGILEDIMTGRVQGTSLDDELEVEKRKQISNCQTHPQAIVMQYNMCIA
jgi:hypothetical protein